MSVIRFQPEAAAASPRQLTRLRDFGGLEKILLLAQEDISRFVRDSLEENFFEVRAAGTGIDALGEIMARDFAAIVCDASLRKFPFEMFYGAVEKIRPRLLSRFIFLMDSDTDPKVVEFVERVDGLKVWRPVELSELFRMIEIVLGRNSSAFD